MDSAILWGIIPVVALMIPIMAIWTSHLREMAKIKAQTGANIPASVQARLDALQREVEQLRETSTKFDLSFDAGLERLEGRMDRMEERGANRYVSATTSEGETVSAGQRG